MLERFLAKIFRLPGLGCWLWIAGRYPNGYGAFRVGSKIIGAHRVSYLLFVGLIPDGLDVLHKCDIPACVRPSHLFVGTHANNMQDKDDKGRGNYATGERHGWAKLTESDVKAIRNDTRLHKEIAAQYNVSRSTVSTVKSGKTWKGGPLFSTNL